ncbi:ATP-binding protein [Halalkalibacter alkalisediminis]|nr:ATP-binding protein [Halalkalibacter alkalisediminis]
MKQIPFYIEESHHTCEYVHGLDRNDIPFPKSNLIKSVLSQKQTEYQEFLTVSRHFVKKLLQFMEGTPTLVLISDDEGYLLEMYGDQTIENQVHTLGIHEGSLFVEKDVGTNSLSLALKLDKPVQLIGTDHYHYCLQSVACFTAPFSYHAPKKTRGTLSIMTTIDYASSFHLGLLSSAVDTIERELKIREQNKRLNILHQVTVDSTRSAIVMTDTNGLITEFNSVGEKMTGRTKADAIKQPIDVLAPISFYMKQVLQSGQKFENLEVTFPSLDDGEKKTCLFDALPIFDESQQLIGAFGQFKDISVRIELQKQVIAAEKLSVLGKLGAGFAHEIRNPLTSVIGFMNLLEKNEEKTLPQKHLNIISSELKRMKSLVDQFVLMAKPSTKEKKVCNITDLIKEMTYLLESQASKANVNIELVSARDVTLPIDESQIKQVMMNLIQNAIEAIAEDGNIKITLSETTIESMEYVQINVEDDGEGMSDSQVVNAFNPFYTTKENGLGLGLSICKQIIEGHKGKLEVTSTKNQGTTFAISLRK